MVGRSPCSRAAPRPLVAFPCGSRSTRRTRFSATASEAARFTAVVVFPTPPFWFAIARTDPIQEPPSARQPRDVGDVPRGIDRAQRGAAFHVEHCRFRSGHVLL